jgi:hypothetical protein
MDLNSYVFSIDMPRSNVCYKLCFFVQVTTYEHTISDSWITRLQINLIARYIVIRVAQDSLSNEKV